MLHYLNSKTSNFNIFIAEKIIIKMICLHLKILQSYNRMCRALFLSVLKCVPQIKNQS